jgi:hypothetical protein
MTLGPWRLIDGIGPEDEDRKLELFDHRSDPWEKRNLATDGDAAIPAELAREVADYRGRAAVPWGEEPPEVELDEMELNQLRALGYVIR